MPPSTGRSSLTTFGVEKNNGAWRHEIPSFGGKSCYSFVKRHDFAQGCKVVARGGGFVILVRLAIASRRGD